MLVYFDRQGGSVLQQELSVLSRFLSFSLIETSNNALAAGPIFSQFACIEISADSGRMAQAGDNAGILDIKKNLWRLYKMVAIGFMDNKEIAREIKSMGETVSYTSLQISNHGS